MQARVAVAAGQAAGRTRAGPASLFLHLHASPPPPSGTRRSTRDLPDSLLATPWLVASEERHGYPDPIVDHAAAVVQAKRRIAAVRQRIRGDGSTKALLERHGSRRPPPARRRR